MISRLFIHLSASSISRVLLVSAAASLLGFSVFAQTSRSDGSSREQAVLMQLERDIGQANIKRDKAFFERVEADEFIFTDSGGGGTTKAEDMPVSTRRLESLSSRAMTSTK